MLNEILVDRMKRFLQRVTGKRVVSAEWNKVQFDRTNFPEFKKGASLVLFDVGANIGQSSLWMLDSFPNSKVYAFEPFSAVFRTLLRNVSADQRIVPFMLAISSRQGTITVNRNDDPQCKHGQVLPVLDASVPTETLQLETIDNFCDTNGILYIDLIKSDAEGHDLEVLRGAKSMLEARKIGAILAEVSVIAGDLVHTNLFELQEFLKSFGYYLYSLYDLSHFPETGQLCFCNALFKPLTAR